PAQRAHGAAPDDLAGGPAPAAVRDAALASPAVAVAEADPLAGQEADPAPHRLRSVQPVDRGQPLPAGDGADAPASPRPLRRPRDPVLHGHPDVVAGAQPPAGDARTVLPRAHAVPVPAVDRSDRARFLPDLRQYPPLPLLCHRPQDLGGLGDDRSADLGAD